MSLETVAELGVITFALALAAIAVINLRARNPRRRGIQLASLLVMLILVAAAFEVVGTWGSILLLGAVVGAEAVYLIRRRGRAA